MKKFVYKTVNEFLNSKRCLHNEDDDLTIQPINSITPSFLETITHNKNYILNEELLNLGKDKDLYGEIFYLTFNDLEYFKTNKKYKALLKLKKEELNNDEKKILENLNNKEKFLFLVEIISSNINNKNQFFTLCTNYIVLNSYINNKTLFKIADFQNLNIEELDKHKDKHYKKLIKFL